MGLTDQGFIRDTIDELEQEAKDNFVATFEDPINNKTPSVEADSFFGLLSGLIAEMRDQIQESIESVYYSFFISTASGVSLDRAVDPTERNDATKSEVVLKFFGTPGAEILGNSLAETAEKVQFATAQTVDIGGGGDVEVNAIAVIAGTSGEVPDNSVVFLPIPISGVDSVTNDLASAGGQEIENDPSLRTKAIDERNIGKTSALDAIVAKVEEVANVSTAIGVENTGIVPDGEGRPSGSFEITVRGGDDTEIAEAILATKPAGVETFGGVTVNLFDSSGNAVAIKFSRPSLIEVFVEYTLTTNASYQASQDDIIRQLCLDYIGGVNPDTVESLGLDISEDVFGYKAQGILFELNNPEQLVGIDIAVVKLSFVSSPIDQDILVIGGAEEAITDFTKITITKI